MSLLSCLVEGVSVPSYRLSCPAPQVCDRSECAPPLPRGKLNEIYKFFFQIAIVSQLYNLTLKLFNKK